MVYKGPVLSLIHFQICSNQRIRITQIPRSTILSFKAKSQTFLSSWNILLIFAYVSSPFIEIFVDPQHRVVGSKLSASFHLLAFLLKANHEVYKPVPGITGAVCVSISISNEIPKLLEIPPCVRSLSRAKPKHVTMVQKQSANIRTVKAAIVICKDNHNPAHPPSPEDIAFSNAAQVLKRMPCSFFCYTNKQRGWVIITRPSAERGPSISPPGQVCCRISSGEEHRKGVCNAMGWICCRICSGKWYGFICVASYWWICYRICLKMKWSLSEYFLQQATLHPQPQVQQSCCRIFLGRTRVYVKL